MPTFAYTARTLEGRDVRGELTAASRRDALSLLSQRSLFPLQLTDQQTKPVSVQQIARRRVKTEHIATALSQLSDLLTNGVPLLESLRLLADQSPNPALRDVMQQVHNHVAEGEALDQAVARYPKVFSPLTVSMIRAGSEGAFLEEALTRVSKFLELQEELKGRVVGAMIYPLILMVVGSIVTVGLIVFMVPKFEGLFNRLEAQGSGLPLATEILLTLSHFLIAYGWLILLALIPAVWGIVKLLQSPGGQAWMDRVKLKLPLAGRIFHDTAVSRFCRVLGTLLRNGVPILKALRISSGSVGNQLLAQAILSSADNISAGQTLSQPLAECGLIPPSTMAMIRIAEESNSLDTVLVSVADSIDQRIEKQLTLMVRFVEPVMLVTIGIAILFVMVALLLPIIEASTTI
jgi:general secretion pathway protein F/type IV pilus assembly protein PilC